MPTPITRARFVQPMLLLRSETLPDGVEWEREFNVKKERRAWSATAMEGSDLKWLPQMETDLTLRSAKRTIIVECKYTESLFEKRFFSEKLRSPHLYQLCAYLRNLEGSTEPDRNADGILLYPTVGIELDQSYRLHGHQVRIKTLDLNQPWTGIEQEMLSLLEFAPAIQPELL
jgi:5-methylcytosine-specific restriction enzyme subunit McrC